MVHLDIDANRLEEILAAAEQELTSHAEHLTEIYEHESGCGWQSEEEGILYPCCYPTDAHQRPLAEGMKYDDLANNIRRLRAQLAAQKEAQ